MMRHGTPLTAALIGAAVFLVRPTAAQDDVRVMRIVPLGADVAVISGFANGNILALRGAEGLLLVDGQSARRVALADSALRTWSPLPVRTVVNTHYHGDHTEGNAHWRRGGAALLAHRSVPAAMRLDTAIAELEWTRRPIAEDAVPDQLVDDSLSLGFGAELVVVLHARSAHTGGDLLVWLPRSNVLHVGDIVEVGAFPFIDPWAGGSLGGMLAACDRIAGLARADTRIVPGHGAVIDRAAVLAYRRMLETVGDRVRRAVEAGQSVDSVLALRPTAEFEGRYGSVATARHFTRALYAAVVMERRARRVRTGSG